MEILLFTEVNLEFFSVRKTNKMEFSMVLPVLGFESVSILLYEGNWDEME